MLRRAGQDMLGSSGEDMAELGTQERLQTAGWGSPAEGSRVGQLEDTAGGSVEGTGGGASSDELQQSSCCSC